MALFDFDFNFPLVDPKTGMASEAFKQWIVINKRDKANRVEDGTENNIALLDSDGNPKDGSAILPTGSVVGTTESQTLTNKILTSPAVTTPTITGGTFTSPTIVTPTIADLTNMTHNHKSAAKGGDYPFADMVLAATQADAVVAHSLTDSAETVDRAELEGILDALGTIINALIDKLQAAKLMT